MKNKQVIIWTGIIFILGGIVLFFSLNKKTTVAPIIEKPVITVATSTVEKSVIKPAVKPVIIPKPIPISTEKIYSLEEVSLHNSQTSCWFAVDGKVYDITKFIASHPAGVNAIMRGCGKDDSLMFKRVGAHSISALASSYLGLLK